MAGTVLQTYFGHGTQTPALLDGPLLPLYRQEVLDNEQEVKALKSFIHADSLTSLQHPFYDPKAEGVEMYMGKYHRLESVRLPSSLWHRNLTRWRITPHVLLKTDGISAILDQSHGPGRSAPAAA